MFNELSHNVMNFESSRKLELSPSKMTIYCAKDILFSSQNVHILVSIHIWLRMVFKRSVLDVICWLNHIFSLLTGRTCGRHVFQIKRIKPCK